MYVYGCNVIRVVDGDTVDVDVDLGFKLHAKMRFRFSGVNAPEMGTPEGMAAKEYLETMMPVGGRFVVSTDKDKTEKYGRYLGHFRSPESPDAISINECMVISGHAIAKVYHSEQDV